MNEISVNVYLCFIFYMSYQGIYPYEWMSKYFLLIYV